jgi:hypothetical protein
MNHHVHHRRDRIALICSGDSCAPPRRREIAWRALLVAAPFAVVAASIALGPRWFGIALAVFAVAAFVACRMTTPGPHVEGTRAPPAGDARWREPRAAARPTSVLDRR